MLSLIFKYNKGGDDIIVFAVLHCVELLSYFIYNCWVLAFEATGYQVICNREDGISVLQYYRNLGPENLCGCDYCRNYCARVKAAYPEAARYLDSLGVDIEKPFETMPLEPDENGYLEYCVCQYVVFGSCPEDFTHQIGDVTFGRSDCHPNTKLDGEHFVLDFYPIRLPFEESESEEI